jgi:hypothetical protein
MQMAWRGDAVSDPQKDGSMIGHMPKSENRSVPSWKPAVVLTALFSAHSVPLARDASCEALPSPPLLESTRELTLGVLAPNPSSSAGGGDGDSGGRLAVGAVQAVQSVTYSGAGDSGELPPPPSSSPSRALGWVCGSQAAHPPLSPRAAPTDGTAPVLPDSIRYTGLNESECPYGAVAATNLRRAITFERKAPAITRLVAPAHATWANPCHAHTVTWWFVRCFFK